MATPSWTLINKANADVDKVLSNVWWAQKKYRQNKEHQTKLQKIYEAEQDILCSCSQAKMFIRYQMGNYTIVNHPILGRHNSNCPYFTQVSGVINHAEFGGEKEFREILTFCLHQEIKPSGDSKANDRGQDKEKSVSKSKLHRLMIQLLSDAFLNLYVSPKHDRNTRKKPTNPLVNFAKLRKAASSIQFGGSTLDHYLFYGEKGESFAGIALNNKKWNGAGRPHVFLIELIDKIERNHNEIIFDGKAHFYENVVKPGRDRTSGPFLAISSIINDEGEQFRHSVCIKPVVSRQLLMPVDSNLEREFALGMVSRMKNETTKKERDYWSIQKPVVARQGKSGEFLLPDFIIMHKHGGAIQYREIIEIMGSDELDYVTRKGRLLPQMKEKFFGIKMTEIKAYKTDATKQFIADFRFSYTPGMK